MKTLDLTTTKFSATPGDLDEDPPGRTQRLTEQEQPLSFLGMRREKTEPPDISGDELAIGGKNVASSQQLRRSTFSPPSQLSSPEKIDWAKDDYFSPKEISPGSSRRLSMLQSDGSHQPGTPSPTAIPLVFRRPPGTGIARSASATPAQSPSLATPKNKKPRPQSTEFKSNEFRPLWLVERHNPKQEVDPHEALPSLPSSHSTSRASSIHDGDLTERFPSTRDPRSQLTLDIEAAQDVKSDLLDSQQATPTAASYQSKKEQDLLDAATQEALSREIEWTQKHNAESQRKDSDRTPIRSIQPLENQHMESPSLDKQRDRATHNEMSQGDPAKSSMAKDLAVATLTAGAGATVYSALQQDELYKGHDLGEERIMTEPAWQEEELHRSKQSTADSRPLSNFKATDDIAGNLEEESTATTGEPDFSLSKKEKKKKTRKGRQTSKDEQNAMSPVTPSVKAKSNNEAAPISPEERRRREEQDTQDAIDTLFEPPTPKGSKKFNWKGRKSRGMSSDQTTKPSESPRDGGERASEETSQLYDNGSFGPSASATNVSGPEPLEPNKSLESTKGISGKAISDTAAPAIAAGMALGSLLPEQGDSQSMVAEVDKWSLTNSKPRKSKKKSTSGVGRSSNSEDALGPISSPSTSQYLAEEVVDEPGVLPQSPVSDAGSLVVQHHTDLIGPVLEDPFISRSAWRMNKASKENENALHETQSQQEVLPEPAVTEAAVDHDLMVRPTLADKQEPSSPQQHDDDLNSEMVESHKNDGQNVALVASIAAAAAGISMGEASTSLLTPEATALPDVDDLDLVEFPQTPHLETPVPTNPVPEQLLPRVEKDLGTSDVSTSSTAAQREPLPVEDTPLQSNELQSHSVQEEEVDPASSREIPKAADDIMSGQATLPGPLTNLPTENTPDDFEAFTTKKKGKKGKKGRQSLPSTPTIADSLEKEPTAALEGRDTTNPTSLVSENSPAPSQEIHGEDEWTAPSKKKGKKNKEKWTDQKSGFADPKESQMESARESSKTMEETQDFEIQAVDTVEHRQDPLAQDRMRHDEEALLNDESENTAVDSFGESLTPSIVQQSDINANEEADLNVEKNIDIQEDDEWALLSKEGKKKGKKSKAVPMAAVAAATVGSVLTSGSIANSEQPAVPERKESHSPSETPVERIAAEIADKPENPNAIDLPSDTEHSAQSSANSSTEVAQNNARDMPRSEVNNQEVELVETSAYDVRSKERPFEPTEAAPAIEVSDEVYLTKPKKKNKKERQSLQTAEEENDRSVGESQVSNSVKSPNPETPLESFEDESLRVAQNIQLPEADANEFYDAEEQRHEPVINSNVVPAGDSSDILRESTALPQYSASSVDDRPMEEVIADSRERRRPSEIAQNDVEQGEYSDKFEPTQEQSHPAQDTNSQFDLPDLTNKSPEHIPLPAVEPTEQEEFVTRSVGKKGKKGKKARAVTWFDDTESQKLDETLPEAMTKSSDGLENTPSTTVETSQNTLSTESPLDFTTPTSKKNKKKDKKTKISTWTDESGIDGESNDPVETKASSSEPSIAMENQRELESIESSEMSALESASTITAPEEDFLAPKSKKDKKKAKKAKASAWDEPQANVDQAEVSQISLKEPIELSENKTDAESFSKDIAHTDAQEKALEDIPEPPVDTFKSKKDKKKARKAQRLAFDETEPEVPRDETVISEEIDPTSTIPEPSLSRDIEPVVSDVRGGDNDVLDTDDSKTPEVSTPMEDPPFEAWPTSSRSKKEKKKSKKAASSDWEGVSEIAEPQAPIETIDKSAQETLALLIDTDVSKQLPAPIEDPVLDEVWSSSKKSKRDKKKAKLVAPTEPEQEHTGSHNLETTSHESQPSLTTPDDESQTKVAANQEISIVPDEEFSAPKKGKKNKKGKKSQFVDWDEPMDNEKPADAQSRPEHDPPIDLPSPPPETKESTTEENTERGAIEEEVNKKSKKDKKKNKKSKALDWLEEPDTTEFETKEQEILATRDENPGFEAPGPETSMAQAPEKQDSSLESFKIEDLEHQQPLNSEPELMEIPPREPDSYDMETKENQTTEPMTAEPQHATMGVQGKEFNSQVVPQVLPETTTSAPQVFEEYEMPIDQQAVGRSTNDPSVMATVQPPSDDFEGFSTKKTKKSKKKSKNFQTLGWDVEPETSTTPTEDLQPKLLDMSATEVESFKHEEHTLESTPSAAVVVERKPAFISKDLTSTTINQIVEHETPTNIEESTPVTPLGTDEPEVFSLKKSKKDKKRSKRQALDWNEEPVAQPEAPEISKGLDQSIVQQPSEDRQASDKVDDVAEELEQDVPLPEKKGKKAKKSKDKGTSLWDEGDSPHTSTTPDFAFGLGTTSAAAVALHAFNTSNADTEQLSRELEDLNGKNEQTKEEVYDRLDKSADLSPTTSQSIAVEPQGGNTTESAPKATNVFEQFAEDASSFSTKKGKKDKKKAKKTQLFAWDEPLGPASENLDALSSESAIDTPNPGTDISKDTNAQESNFNPEEFRQGSSKKSKKDKKKSKQALSLAWTDEPAEPLQPEDSKIDGEVRDRETEAPMEQSDLPSSLESTSNPKTSSGTTLLPGQDEGDFKVPIHGQFGMAEAQAQEKDASTRQDEELFEPMPIKKAKKSKKSKKAMTFEPESDESQELAIENVAPSSPAEPAMILADEVPRSIDVDDSTPQPQSFQHLTDEPSESQREVAELPNLDGRNTDPLADPVEDEFTAFISTKKKGKKGKKGKRLEPETWDAGDSSTPIDTTLDEPETLPRTVVEPEAPVIEKRVSESFVEEPVTGTVEKRPLDEHTLDENDGDWSSFGTTKRKNKKGKKEKSLNWEEATATSTFPGGPSFVEPENTTGQLSPLEETRDTVMPGSTEDQPRGFEDSLLIEDTAGNDQPIAERSHELMPSEHQGSLRDMISTLPAAGLLPEVTEDPSGEVQGEPEDIWDILATSKKSKKNKKKQKESDFFTESPRSSTQSSGLLPLESIEASKRIDEQSLAKETVDIPSNIEAVETTVKSEHGWDIPIKKSKKSKKSKKQPHDDWETPSTDIQPQQGSEMITTEHERPLDRTATDPSLEGFPQRRRSSAARSQSRSDAIKAVGAVGAGIALFEGLHRSSSMSEPRPPPPVEVEQPKKKKKGSKRIGFNDEDVQEPARSIETDRHEYRDQSLEPTLPVGEHQLHHDKIEDRGEESRGRSINRDSAVDIPDSPKMSEKISQPYNMRDSGYQGTEASPVVPHGSDHFDGDPSHHFERTSRELFSARESGDHPLNISIEADPQYEISISRPEYVESVGKRNSREVEGQKSSQVEQGLDTTESPTLPRINREPSPIDSTTKDRSAALFSSSPSTRDDPHYPARQRSLDATTTPGANHSKSLFGGPVGINSDLEALRSPPRTPVGFDSAAGPLTTIAEHSPEESPLLKKLREISDIGHPDHALKAPRRSDTPQSRRARPPHSEGARRLDMISTDDLISRLSWPEVDEENHSVDLERSRSRTRDMDRERRSSGRHSQPSSLTIDPAKHHEQEHRSISGASIRSSDSINAIIKSPASRPSATPPLRRVDGSVSSDLRGASMRSASGGSGSGKEKNAKPGGAEADREQGKEKEKEGQLQLQPDQVIASSSTYDPTLDKGKGRITKMTDVYVSKIVFS